MNYPRDLAGYGQNPPKANWPNDAKIAVQFVLNYEEGGENNILHGDECSEAFLSEIIGASNWQGQRHWNMESIYEYGARAGFWRLHDLFTKANIPLTIYGVATALARSPRQVEAMQNADWEIASHGLKWIEYKDYSREDELDHIKKAIALHKAVTGMPPLGWYTGRSSMNTVDLISEIGSFEYVADSYADDLPYWYHHQGQEQLVIPYTLDCNDMRFSSGQGFNTGKEFYTHLKDSFDTLYQEGSNGHPKMMSIGLHCRIIGRPGRLEGLKRFIEYAKNHGDVWFAKRIDIAQHWAQNCPARTNKIVPSRMDEATFLDKFGGVYEHSAWVAKAAYDAGLGAANDESFGLNFALRTQFRLASDQERLDVLKAHPDLAGKLASAKLLTNESTHEQASAGLDALTQNEKESFEALNSKYTQKFGFPFIIAVRDYSKQEILNAFETRLENDPGQELETACKMVERIAELRIETIMEDA